jgi:hypothetical protein
MVPSLHGAGIVLSIISWRFHRVATKSFAENHFIDEQTQ